jgi:hypothetical protein
MSDQDKSVPDKTPGPRATDHAYNSPGLNSKEFLLAIMRDQTVPLARRIDVACKLLELWPHPWQYVPSHLTIHIGGLGTDIPEADAPEPRPTVHVTFTLPGKSPFSVEADGPRTQMH